MHRVANESFNALPTMSEALVTGELAPSDLQRQRQVDSRMDALAAENAQLREAVDKHSSMHAMHARIMAAHAHDRCAGANCHDVNCECPRCVACKEQEPVVHRKQTMGEKHTTLLAKLDGELKTANRRYKHK
jgi:hypothetical protein